MAGEDLAGGEEPRPVEKMAIPGSQALEEGFRAIIAECVEKYAFVREVQHRPFGLTDDKTRDDERRARDRQREVEAVVRLFDRHMPNPEGVTWRSVIFDQAKAREEQRMEDADEGN